VRERDDYPVIIAVALLVVLACAVAVYLSASRLVRITAVATIDPKRFLERANPRPTAAVVEPTSAAGVGVLVQLVQELNVAESLANRRAIHRELVLTVEDALGRSAAMNSGIWRIGAGAGLAGLLFTVWDEASVGFALGGVGATCALCCAVCIREAESRRRRALAAWRRYIEATAVEPPARGRVSSRTAGLSTEGSSA